MKSAFDLLNRIGDLVPDRPTAGFSGAAFPDHRTWISDPNDHCGGYHPGVAAGAFDSLRVVRNYCIHLREAPGCSELLTTDFLQNQPNSSKMEDWANISHS